MILTDGQPCRNGIPLKHAPVGFWSRRITGEHRIVYRVEDDALLIAQLRLTRPLPAIVRKSFLKRDVGSTSYIP
ncbi:MAG TPA: type II toxin-antitoxin system YoeB family toxin [Aminobacteriaceae bacterium]|nr:type II toxin-antitoxin system YoeB family toxin [Aminobacteriaceae bacterium]